MLPAKLHSSQMGEKEEEDSKGTDEKKRKYKRRKEKEARKWMEGLGHMERVLGILELKAALTGMLNFEWNMLKCRTKGEINYP
jgi:hypothetical protein